MSSIEDVSLLVTKLPSLPDRAPPSPHRKAKIIVREDTKRIRPRADLKIVEAPENNLPDENIMSFTSMKTKKGPAPKPKVTFAEFLAETQKEKKRHPREERIFHQFVDLTVSEEKALFGPIKHRDETLQKYKYGVNAVTKEDRLESTLNTQVFERPLPKGDPATYFNVATRNQSAESRIIAQVAANKELPSKEIQLRPGSSVNLNTFQLVLPQSSIDFVETLGFTANNATGPLSAEVGDGTASSPLYPVPLYTPASFRRPVEEATGWGGGAAPSTATQRYNIGGRGDGTGIGMNFSGTGDVTKPDTPFGLENTGDAAILDDASVVGFAAAVGDDESVETKETPTEQFGHPNNAPPLVRVDSSGQPVTFVAISGSGFGTDTLKSPPQSPPKSAGPYEPVNEVHSPSRTASAGRSGAGSRGDSSSRQTPKESRGGLSGFSPLNSTQNSPRGGGRGDGYDDNKPYSSSGNRPNSRQRSGGISGGAAGNVLHCIYCAKKVAVLWCGQCQSAYCGPCWGKVDHHTLDNMIPLPGAAATAPNTADNTVHDRRVGGGGRSGGQGHATSPGGQETGGFQRSYSCFVETPALKPRSDTKISYHKDYPLNPVYLTGTGGVYHFPKDGRQQTDRSPRNRSPLGRTYSPTLRGSREKGTMGEDTMDWGTGWDSSSPQQQRPSSGGRGALRRTGTASSFGSGGAEVDYNEVAANALRAGRLQTPFHGGGASAAFRQSRTRVKINNTMTDEEKAEMRRQTAAFEKKAEEIIQKEYKNRKSAKPVKPPVPKVAVNKKTSVMPAEWQNPIKDPDKVKALQRAKSAPQGLGLESIVNQTFGGIGVRTKDNMHYESLAISKKIAEEAKAFDETVIKGWGHNNIGSSSPIRKRVYKPLVG